jgi:hypothetical protein
MKKGRDISHNAVVQIIVACPGATAFSKMTAGTGWFPSSDTLTSLAGGPLPEGLLLTNAHVVRNSKQGGVYIRLPASHTTDIPVYVHALSIDLDIAVLRLDYNELRQVKDILKQRYGSEVIPTLELADSDNINHMPQVAARGYPLGQEYQMITDGRITGLKRAMEQEYITHGALINPGNSGGPLEGLKNTNLSGMVYGINSMKIRGAEGIAMSIPSNRIRRVLPELMNNQYNDVQMKKLEQQQALAKILFAKKLGGGEDPSREQVEKTKKMMTGLADDVNIYKCCSVWNQNNVGGFKRTNGIVSPVSLSDFYHAHIENESTESGHLLFERVFHHLNEDRCDELTSMRKDGWSKYKCETCSAGAVCGNRSQIISMTPPRVLHMPRLGFKYSNSTDATFKYYKCEGNVNGGVIVHTVDPKGLFGRQGVTTDDLLYKIENMNGIYELDKYGQAWYADHSVSRPVKDIVHRTEFKDTIKLHVIDKTGEKKVREVHYDILRGDERPEIRFLDSLEDAPLKQQMCKFRGIVLTPLRLEEAIQFKHQKYCQPKFQNSFRVVVADIENGTAAYHSQNIRPGFVLESVNDQKMEGLNWEKFMSVLKAAGEEPVRLQVEEDRVLII